VLKGLEEAGPEPLFQVCGPGLARQFPPLRTLSSHPNNLPASTSAFVGRQQALREVAALLAQDGVRLVTIVGFGGSGKTRLALEAAGDLVHRYPAGVWFADLAPLSDPDDVLLALVQACGLEDDPAAQTPLRQLQNHFRDRRALLLLDNFEQVEDAADDVARLLKACAGLQVLVTSRVLLSLSMEYAYPLDPMPADECAQLFAARARQVDPDFALNGENRAAVEAICRQLDGSPLVVELAAAQTRGMTLAEIARTLDQRLQRLTIKRRDLPPRHRSLRAAIDWSYDLLEPTEQQLFCALSVFAGSFSAEAADAICGPPNRPGGSRAGRTADLLSDLCDKSLVRREPAPAEGGPPHRRFSLQESLRQYGVERLDENEDDRGRLLAERHADFFLALAEQQEPLLDAKSAEDGRAALARLEAEAANMRAGMERLLAWGWSRRRRALAWLCAAFGRCAAGSARVWSVWSASSGRIIRSTIQGCARACCSWPDAWPRPARVWTGQRPCMRKACIAARRPAIWPACQAR
jgi:predicted ATPase